MDKAAAARLFRELYLEELAKTPEDASGAAARAATQFSARGNLSIEASPAPKAVRAEKDLPSEVASGVQAALKEPHSEEQGELVGVDASLPAAHNTAGGGSDIIKPATTESAGNVLTTPVSTVQVSAAQRQPQHQADLQLHSLDDTTFQHPRLSGTIDTDSMQQMDGIESERHEQDGIATNQEAEPEFELEAIYGDLDEEMAPPPSMSLADQQLEQEALRALCVGLFDTDDAAPSFDQSLHVPTDQMPSFGFHDSEPADQAAEAFEICEASDHEDGNVDHEGIAADLEEHYAALEEDDKQLDATLSEEEAETEPEEDPLDHAEESSCSSEPATLPEDEALQETLKAAWSSCMSKINDEASRATRLIGFPPIRGKVILWLDMSGGHAADENSAADHIDRKGDVGLYESSYSLLQAVSTQHTDLSVHQAMKCIPGLVRFSNDKRKRRVLKATESIELFGTAALSDLWKSLDDSGDRDVQLLYELYQGITLGNAVSCFLVGVPHSSASPEIVEVRLAGQGFLSCIAIISAAKKCFQRGTSLTAADTFVLLEKELRSQLAGQEELGMIIRIGQTLDMPVAAIRGTSLCHATMLCCIQMAPQGLVENVNKLELRAELEILAKQQLARLAENMEFALGAMSSQPATCAAFRAHCLSLPHLLPAAILADPRYVLWVPSYVTLEDVRGLCAAVSAMVAGRAAERDGHTVTVSKKRKRDIIHERRCLPRVWS